MALPTAGDTLSERMRRASYGRKGLASRTRAAGGLGQSGLLKSDHALRSKDKESYELVDEFVCRLDAIEGEEMEVLAVD